MENQTVTLIERDENENITHFKSHWFECWREYDELGNLIRYRNSKGANHAFKYDSNGNCIAYRTEDGILYVYKYDEKNRCVYEKHGSHEIFYEYDERDNVIFILQKKYNSKTEEVWSLYDKDNRLVYRKHDNGFEYWIDYTSSGNKIGQHVFKP